MSTALHDPTVERDACGIGLVADSRSRASREVVDRALAGLAAVSHRGAWAADGVTGDGAGLLLPLHHALTGVSLRGCRDVLPPRAVAPRGRGGGMPCRAPRAARLARRPSRRRRARLERRGDGAADRPARARAVRGRRRRAARLPRAPARGARRGRLHRVALVPHGDLQGALRGDPARDLLPRSPRSRVGRVVGDLPPAVLDEHRAELGARAAVPSPVPQRRDQHDRGQRRLDGGPRARARSRAGARARARPVGLRLGAPRQRARASRPRGRRRLRRAVAARPARVAERPARRRGGARDAQVPRDARRAVGRACRASSSRTGSPAAPSSTATVSARCGSP